LAAVLTACHLNQLIMQRIKIQPRKAWQKAVENLGFGFHTTNVPYWDESAYYAFEMDEILAIEKATAELWTMCLDAVQHVMDEGLYEKFAIPEWIVPYIERTWTEDHPAIYGRFDLCYKNGQIKLLEFNADTPTSLYEAGIVQWFWLQDFDKTQDQFNSVHEKLIDYWKYLKAYLNPGPLHFACLKETLEDLTNTEYMRDCAMQAGLQTKLVFVDDIGWDKNASVFVDMENEPIKNIFKLYPWEWLLTDDFGKNILEDRNRAFWIEPAWKMILSNKAILPILWELYPNHPYLLPAYFESNRLTNYVKKPILGREGANVNLVRNNDLLQHTEGAYGKEGFIFQELFELPDFSGGHPVLGSWVIGQEPAGMGIREADNLITGNTSRFVPHLITK
jgi:glutathionylspermidine synthase